MPDGFDNTWGIVKDSSLASSIFALTFSIYVLSVLMLSFSFSAIVRLNITDKQEDFIRWVLEIPFEQRKCRNLITLDMLHANCGGLEPTPTAHRLNTFSRWHKYHLTPTKMELARQRAQVKAVIMRRKEEEKKAKGKEGASLSTLKVVNKGAPKRKVDGKDNRPPKKVSVTPEEKLPKKSLPPKPSHGAGKGLMTTSGPITQEPNHCLLTHKDYVVEVIESIIKDKDVDPCAEQMTKELGALGLFDLTRVRLFLFSFFFIYSLLKC